MSLARAWRLEAKRKSMRDEGKCERCPPHAGENLTGATMREARHRKTDRKVTKMRRSAR